MKRTNGLYIVLALTAGLLLGYLLFGGRVAGPEQHAHETTVAGEALWTCSMHPQILQSEPGKCPICGMELIPVEGDEAGLTAGQFTLTENAMALADIRTMTVGDAESLSKGLLLSGTIKENEEANAVQSSYFDGRIENLYINTTGETVHKGQRLATIYAPALVAAQQELLSTASLKNTQPSLYEAVRNKLKLWKLSESQVDAIESSGKVQEFFPVFATVTGTVTDKLVSEGDYVQQGQALFRITDLGTVWAVFDAYEQQLSVLSVGQQLRISSNAYPNNSLEGRISFIDPVLDSRTRTVEVRAVLENSQGLLKPGMFVQGRVSPKAPATSGALMVPTSAVMWTGERSVVYVRSGPEQPVFEMREVLLGERPSEDQVAILEGLVPGEEIVVNGTFTVDAAAQLKGKKSMMNPEGGISATGHEGHSGMAPVSPVSIPSETTTPESFQRALNKALDPYFVLKDALFAGEPEEVATAAGNALRAFRALAVPQGQEVLSGAVSESLEQLTAMAASHDLEMQRAHFVALNEQLVSLVKRLKTPDNVIYIQHCPMADSNKGANWMSLDKEIRNPYYGNAMPGCGSVTDTIK